MGSWKQTSKELIQQTALFRLFRVGYRSEKSGKEGHFDVLESKDWVNVIPFTDDGHVLMVEQFRFGIGTTTLEFPAGNIEVGQTPLSAALRELKEETGGEPVSIEFVGRCYGNPAFLNNYCHHFVASGVKLNGEQQLDEHEELSFRKVPVGDVDALIASGAIRHSLSIATWYFHRSRQASSN
ncbi:MAG: NUDIX hydrolase [Proteobacteria bacterium]|nr:MAG: NUDIX hydrolase [Pseudomonadota bacterium]